MIHIKRIDEMLGGLLYDNMPSSDKNKCRPVKVSKDDIKKILESDKAKNIIRKHNAVVGYGSEKITLMILFEGNYKTNSKQYWKNKEITEKEFQEMLHELDLNTDLYFEVSWAGNVGWCANKQTYPGDVYSYKNMDDSEYDFEPFYALKSYIRNFAKTHGEDNTYSVSFIWGRYDFNIKGYNNSTDIKYEDIKNDILEYSKSYIEKKYPKFKISLATGKRISDTGGKPYEAFVVEYKGAGDPVFKQKGSFVITQNRFGDGKISLRAPLSGETETSFDFNDWKKCIGDAIDYLCN